MDGGIRIAQIKCRFIQVGMPQKDPGQLVPGIARGSDDGYLHAVRHRNISLSLFSSVARAARVGQITKMVSSPARVPATSFQRCASSAAAKGCAPLGGVFSTNMFCAGLMSIKNSLTARANGGRVVGAVSSGVAVSER